MQRVSLAQASEAGYDAAMNETVRILLPVSPEAAAVLSNEDRLQEVGQFVSALVLRTPSSGQDAAADTFIRTLLETRTAAASSLTDADVDAELAAWKLERAARRR
jgi:hypothetical protein